MKEQTKKKILICIAALLIISISLSVVRKFGLPLPDQVRVVMANVIYGRKPCSCDHNDMISLPAFEEHVCLICGIRHESNYLGYISLCDKCLDATGRCSKCGGLTEEKE